MPVIAVGIDGCRHPLVRRHVAAMLRAVVGNKIKIEVFVRREEYSRRPRQIVIAGCQCQRADFGAEFLRPLAGCSFIVHWMIH